MGEVCHFVDLLQFFCAAAPTQVWAASVGGDGDPARLQDNVSVQVSFADGSLGTIVYTSLGARTLAKERVEIFAGGAGAVLDNFKQTLVYGAAVKKQGGGKQDKGQAQMLQAFVRAIQRGEPMPIPVEEIVNTSLVTFGALEALRRNEPVRLL